MKQKLRLAIGPLLLVLFGAWIYWAQLGVHSTTFAGPEFHSRNVDECATVGREFLRHLEELGLDSSGKEGANRLWYQRKESNNQRTFVSIDLDKAVVRASVKWEVYGTGLKVGSAKQAAYKTAITLDDWIAARKETNELPQKQRDEKRRDFAEKLAESQQS